MAKEAMYWALIAPRYSVHALSIMRVTSEKKGQVYGSTEFMPSTHCRIDDVRAKFKSEETAKMAKDGIKKIIDDYKPLHEEAAKQAANLWTKERTAIEAYLKSPICL